MQIRVPEYFLKFKCIADKCQDSCCIGWEIDIDDATRESYANLDTELGREIVEKTKGGFFPLEKNGRCAFLDAKGLCRIISSVGEGYLCDICREHPRYYGISADGLEGGLGLGCEEAARLILESGGTAEFGYIEHSPSYVSEDELASFTDNVREMIYAKIKEYDASKLAGYLLTLAPILDGLAFDVCAGLEAGDVPDIEATSDHDALASGYEAFLELVSECEALTDEWRISTTAAQGVDPGWASGQENAFKSLIFYFTHRYVRECIEDMSLGQRILFSLYSALFIIALAKSNTYDGATVRAAVDFSKNIEYSTDNVDMILDGLSGIL